MLDIIFVASASFVLGLVIGFALNLARCEMCKKGFVKSLDDLQNRFVKEAGL